MAEKKDTDYRKVEKNRKAMEAVATFGLILVAVGLAAPFANMTDTHFISIFKWVYAPGAVIFTLARLFYATDPRESMRIRRIRRIEFWAGIAFCIAAGFWFYNDDRYSKYLLQGYGALTYLRETILFSLVGAFLQVIASGLVSWCLRKEGKIKNAGK